MLDLNNKIMIRYLIKGNRKHIKRILVTSLGNAAGAFLCSPHFLIQLLSSGRNHSHVSMSFAESRLVHMSTDLTPTVSR